MARGRSFTARAPRRKTQWFGGPGSTAVTAVTASGSQLLGVAVSAAAGQEDHTLIRTRGILDIVMTSATSGGDGFFGAVGIGLVTTPAIVAGVASVPTPISEVEWDGWLWHSFFSVHASIGGAFNNPSSAFRMEIDSKAMRKLEGTQMSLYAAIEVVEIGASAISVFLNTRTLHKLP